MRESSKSRAAGYVKKGTTNLKTGEGRVDVQDLQSIMLRITQARRYIQIFQKQIQEELNTIDILSLYLEDIQKDLNFCVTNATSHSLDISTEGDFQNKNIGSSGD